MKLVSIIVPIYNVEEYLNRCIRSIIRQTYENLEIILVDDGSTDNCFSICQDWGKKDSRIKVIHQKNGGLSAARNTGIDVATGQYIMFLDSDDYLSPYCIETMVDLIQVDNADVVIGNFVNGNEDNYNFTKDINYKKNMSGVDAIRQIYNNDEDALKFTSACAKLYRKNLFKNIRYPSGKLYEDIFTTHKVLYLCKNAIVIGLECVYYFQRITSIMHDNYNLKKLDYLQALKERLYFYYNNNLLDLASIAYDVYLHSLIWEYSRTRDILKNKKAMKAIQKEFNKVYKFGYSSTRYVDENKYYLMIFRIHPELLVLKWKIDSKIKRILNKGGI